MKSKVQDAVDLFTSGFNCAQAILTTYSRGFGLDRDTALKLACGFGAGMGKMAYTCGAVTGAFMVIGLSNSQSSSQDSGKRAPTYTAVRQFAKKFEARNGSISCKDLMGCDISTDSGYNNAVEKGLFRSVCPKMVQDAAEILEEMLSK